MGVTVVFQAVATRPGGPRLQRLLYVFVTTGLCGSITSFSTWHGEVAKRFVLPVYANVTCDKSTVVARVLEYAAHLGAGLTLPFCFFIFGTHFGEALASWQWLCGSPPIVQNIAEHASIVRAVPDGDDCDSCCSHCADITDRFPVTSEVVIAVIAVASTLGAVGLPLVASAEWLCPVALLGAAGAYTRYMLSKWNPLWPTFPLGTFMANMLGTALLATSESLMLNWLAGLVGGCVPRSSHTATWSSCNAVDVFADFRVNEANVKGQSLLYAVATGFCGCLTTMSTFVFELNKQPRSAAYRYCLISLLAAQLLVTGIIAAGRPR